MVGEVRSGVVQFPLGRVLFNPLLATLDLVEIIRPRHAQPNIDWVPLSASFAFFFEFFALVGIERPEAAFFRAVGWVFDFFEAFV